MLNRLSESGRWLVIFSLVAALSIGVAACGDDDNGDNSNNSSKSDSNNGSDSNAQSNPNADTGSNTSDSGSSLSSGSNTVDESSSSEGVAGGRFFASNSPWNTEIDGLGIDPNSNRMLDLATERKAVRENPGQEGLTTIVRRVTKGLYVNTEAWACLLYTSDAADE